MPRILIEIEGETPQEVSTALTGLAGIFAAQAAGGAPVTVTAEVKPKADKPKPTATTKPKPAPEPEPEVEEVDEDEAALLAEADEGDEAPEITMDDLKGAMAKAIKKVQAKGALTALRTACNGAAKLSDLKPAQYAAAYEALTAAAA